MSPDGRCLTGPTTNKFLALRSITATPTTGSNSFDHQASATTGSSITTPRPNKVGPTGLSTSRGHSLTGRTQNKFYDPRSITATSRVESNSFDHLRFVTTGPSITTCRPNKFGATGLSTPRGLALTGRAQNNCFAPPSIIATPTVESNSFDHQRFVTTSAPITTCRLNKLGPAGLSTSCGRTLTGHAMNAFLSSRFTTDAATR